MGLNVPVITLTLVEYTDPSRENNKRGKTIKNNVTFFKDPTQNDSPIPWGAWVSGSKLDFFERFSGDVGVFKIHYGKTIEEAADPTGEKREAEGVDIRLDLLEKKMSQIWEMLMVEVPKPKPDPPPEIPESKLSEPPIYKSPPKKRKTKKGKKK